MERTSTISIRFALGLLAALFALNVYRAVANDVTPAEAWNYDRYTVSPWQISLHQFDLNNHVLNTLLGRISTAALGRKEIAIRLPSLLAGLLFYWAAWRLLRRLFGGWTFLAALALLTLNPLVVDSLSQARGYGLAMAFWLCALDRILLYLDTLEARNLNLAALCLALSVTACLTFIIPVLGLALATNFLLRRPLARDLWLPLAVFLFVLLAIPLNRALLSDFAVGATSLRQTLAELTAASFAALPGNSAAALWAALRILAGLLTAAGVLAALRTGRSEPMLSLTAGTTLIGLLLLLVAHAWIKSPFPQQGGIYLVPLLTLLGLALCRRLPKLVLPLALACSLIYAAALTAGPYREGRAYAGSREIAKALRADARQRPVRIAASLELEPIVNYYRSRYRQGNWEPVPRKPLEEGYDYYLLTPADAPLAERLHLRIVRRVPAMLLAAR